MKRVRIFLLAMVVALCVVAGAAWRRSAEVDGYSVEVYRLIDKWDNEPPVITRLEPEYIAGRGVAPTRAGLRALLAVLKPYLDDPKFNDGGMLCEPQPGVAFRIWKDHRATDVLVCEHCHYLRIVRPDHPGWQGFRNPELTRIVKECFPNDPAIQGLKV